MENSLVTYGFNKDREGIEHLKWISDLSSNSKYVVCFNRFFAGKYFCEISSLCEFNMLCNLTNLHSWVEM